MSGIETVLAQRLIQIQKIKRAFQELVDPSLERFRRGDFQRRVLESIGLPFSGQNKKLVNEVAFKLGYVRIAITGERLYKRVH